MIRNLAEFLQQLKDREATRLGQMGVTHGPTIGDMYEGLSMDLLERAIPSSLQLRLVSGFIVDGGSEESGQIDCMLVKGAGEEIPYTGNYKWHIKDVIAVFEIKKSLYGADLADAFNHLGVVKSLESGYISRLRGRDPVDITAARAAFAETTGIVAPEGSDDTRLSPFLRMIRHILILEQVGCVRVILGYDGFRTESGFRRALVSHLKSNLEVRGFGPGNFPQLIISGGFSLAKANGQPFSSPIRDGWWPFYFSTSVNPVQLLLEFIWTRLARDYRMGNLWGDDLIIETARALILGRLEERSDQYGWVYQYVQATEAELAAVTNEEDWQPQVLNLSQFAVIQMLCAGHTVHVDDDLLRSLEVDPTVTTDEFVRGMIETRLVAVDEHELQLITVRCQPVILPDGRFVAGEDNSGRMTRWLARNFPGERPENTARSSDST